MVHNTPFILTLYDYIDIAPNTRHFIFTSEQPIVFLPGQFITLHWDDAGKRIHRSYSLANYGGYNAAFPNRLELAATYVKEGFASQKLFAMQKGDQIEATGPGGRLILKDERVDRYLLIATGAGVTPYRTMLTSLADRMQINLKLQVLLLFGVRYPRDVLYREEFLAFAEKYPRFEFQVYYSREPNPSLPYERIGYVTHSLVGTTFRLMPDQDIVYLCGHPGMVDDIEKLLSEKGLPRDRIRQERYRSPRARAH